MNEILIQIWTALIKILLFEDPKKASKAQMAPLKPTVCYSIEFFSED